MQLRGLKRPLTHFERKKKGENFICFITVCSGERNPLSLSGKIKSPFTAAVKAEVFGFADCNTDLLSLGSVDKTNARWEEMDVPKKNRRWEFPRLLMWEFSSENASCLSLSWIGGGLKEPKCNFSLVLMSQLMLARWPGKKWEMEWGSSVGEAFFPFDAASVAR